MRHPSSAKPIVRHSHSKPRGGVLLTTITAVTTLAVLTGVIYSTVTPPGTDAPAAPVTQPPAADQPKGLTDKQKTAILMRRAGLTPEVLAASGVAPGQLDQMVSVLTAYEQDSNALAAMTESTKVFNQVTEASAREPHERTRPADKGGMGLDQAVADAVPNDARSALDTHLARAREFACGPLVGSLSKKAIDQIVANTHWQLPAPYLATELTEADVVAIRSSINAKSFYEGRGADVPPVVNETLAKYDNRPEVKAAKSLLESNLKGVQADWDRLLEGQ